MAGWWETPRGTYIRLVDAHPEAASEHIWIGIRCECNMNAVNDNLQKKRGAGRERGDRGVQGREQRALKCEGAKEPVRLRMREEGGRRERERRARACVCGANSMPDLTQL